MSVVKHQRASTVGSRFLLKWLLAPLWLCVFPFLAVAESEWEAVERIIAIGDVHGDYDNFVSALQEAELINRRRNWIGGSAHLVQVGDLPDRGPDTDKIIELIQKLEDQAEDDGGKVHALIGNHEAMNMIGDLRYVHPGEYAAFRNRSSRQLRDNFYARHIAQLQAADPEFIADSAYRDAFDAQYPLGYVEHRIAWAPQGDIGAWVLQHSAVLKIGRNLFLHGGISPEVLGTDIDTINATIRSELGGNLGEEPGLSEQEFGPLWYRGQARNSSAEEAAHLDAVLAFYDVDRLIIGHTPGLGTVVPRFGGKVLVVDTGMASYYGSYIAALEIITNEQQAVLTTLQEGERISVPTNEADIAAYLETVAELLDEPPAPLLQAIQALTAPAEVVSQQN